MRKFSLLLFLTTVVIILLLVNKILYWDLLVWLLITINIVWAIVIANPFRNSTVYLYGRLWRNKSDNSAVLTHNGQTTIPSNVYYWNGDKVTKSSYSVVGYEILALSLNHSAHKYITIPVVVVPNGNFSIVGNFKILNK